MKYQIETDKKLQELTTTDNKEITQKKCGETLIQL